MAGSPASSSGTKRARSESTNDSQQPKKRVKVTRRLKHAQKLPQNVEPAPQDPVFVQGQLLRSISAALAMVGFDSVKPTALEMFRSHVEEYMLNFLHFVRTSMSANHGTNPTPSDFAAAMALIPNASTASLLKPQLNLPIPELISYPSIPEPDPPPEPAPDFSKLLQPLVNTASPHYIPSHFPKLPPQHSWKHTPVYPEREKDASRMREKATEEGILAEQALRKLAAAAKTGAVKAEKKRLDVLGETGRRESKASANGIVPKGAKRRDSQTQEEMFAAMMRQVTGEGYDPGEQDAVDLGSEGARDLRDEGFDVGMPEGVVVNWDASDYRKSGRKGARH